MAVTLSLKLHSSGLEPAKPIRVPALVCLGGASRWPCMSGSCKGAEQNRRSLVSGSSGQEQGKPAAGLSMLFGLKWTKGIT